MTGAPKNQGTAQRIKNPFPDPVGLFGAPWRPFWIFEVLIDGMIELKNLFSKNCFFLGLSLIAKLSSSW